MLSLQRILNNLARSTNLTSTVRSIFTSKPHLQSQKAVERQEEDTNLRSTTKNHEKNQDERDNLKLRMDNTSKDDICQNRNAIDKRKLEDTFTPYRYVFPEFLPDPNPNYRNKIREKLERMDMLKRRANIDIPEFYVGSILSVTVSDANAPGKKNTFVGICTERGGVGLRSFFTLRNVVDGAGIEITYDLYNPTILSITCLKLEKRLDDNLRYLRDADPKYSTFSFDMPQEIRSPDSPVPINQLKVKLKPKPWTARWQYWDLKGVEDFSHELTAEEKKKLKVWKSLNAFDYKEYDLMKTYRSTIPVEEQTEIYSEMVPQITKLQQTMKKQKRKRAFVKPTKEG